MQTYPKIKFIMKKVLSWRQLDEKINTNASGGTEAGSGAASCLTASLHRHL